MLFLSTECRIQIVMRVFVSLCCVMIIGMGTIVAVRKRHNDNLKTLMDFNHNVTVVVITSKSSAERIPVLMDTWGNEFLLEPYSGGLFFDYIDWDEAEYPTVSKPVRLLDLLGEIPNDRRKIFELAVKEIAAAEYFLYYTSSAWLLRIVDDAFVRLTSFRRLVDEQLAYESEAVLFGDCIDGNVPFLHEDSGYLMSRAMAAKIVEYGDAWIMRIAKGSDIARERYFNELLKIIKFDVVEAASPIFMGLFIGDNYREYQIKKCPAVIRTKHCPARLNKVRETAVFHDVNDVMKMDEWEDFLESLPNDAMWGQEKNKDFLCRYSR